MNNSKKELYKDFYDSFKAINKEPITPETPIKYSIDIESLDLDFAVKLGLINKYNLNIEQFSYVNERISFTLTGDINNIQNYYMETYNTKYEKQLKKIFQ